MHTHTSHYLPLLQTNCQNPMHWNTPLAVWVCFSKSTGIFWPSQKNCNCLAGPGERWMPALCCSWRKDAIRKQVAKANLKLEPALWKGTSAWCRTYAFSSWLWIALRRAGVAPMCWMNRRSASQLGSRVLIPCTKEIRALQVATEGACSNCDYSPSPSNSAQ